MILVSGATGFVGGAVVAQLLNKGHDVLSISRTGKSIQGEHHLNVDLSKLEDYSVLKEFAGDITGVIHLAGKVEISLVRNPLDSSLCPIPGDEDACSIYQNNFIATVNLAKFCTDHKIDKFIFASSQAVYGLPECNPVTEASQCKPLEHYAMSKLFCEDFLRLQSFKGLNTAVLRFPGVFGEGRESGIVVNLINSALRNGIIEVYSDYPLPFDVIHVDDVAGAFIRALNRPMNGFDVFNIATGEPCSLGLLASDIASIIDGSRVLNNTKNQPVISLDSSAANRELNWVARPRRESLCRLVTYLENVS